MMQRHTPTPQNPFTACPQCGAQMIFVEKDTMNGNDIRTYHCKHCGTDHDLNFGTALWKLIADADKADPGDER